MAPTRNQKAPTSGPSTKALIACSFGHSAGTLTVATSRLNLGSDPESRWVPEAEHPGWEVRPRESIPSLLDFNYKAGPNAWSAEVQELQFKLVSRWLLNILRRLPNPGQSWQSPSSIRGSSWTGSCITL